MCTGHSRLHEITSDAHTTTPDTSAPPNPFGQRMVGALNDAALMLMTSIGHRTGLFDAMAVMPPADSVAIAGETDLNERYVREWLGAMVTAGVVEHDPVAGIYALPKDHAAWLTRAAGAQNLGTVTMELPPRAWGQRAVTATVVGGYVQFDPTEAAVCYAVIVDNATNDGRFLAATEYKP